jgi:two-component system phosphate regulon sensor histidine kinase PhoR
VSELGLGAHPRAGAWAPAAEAESTIVAVHDDRRVTALLRDLVADARGRVVEAADHATGLVLAQSLRPDCLVLAAELPGLQRAALLEELRRDARTRQVPGVVVSAEAESAEGVERALGEGAADYIGPAVPPELVAARVRGVIRRARARRDLGEVGAEFLAMLVHDLRTPLTVVQGYLDLLEGGAGDRSEVLGRYVRAMQACCGQMTGLVTEILDLYKLEAAGLVAERRPMDLAAVVTAVAGRFASAARARRIALEIAGAAKPLWILGDPGRLDQVLMNLLGNALKFTPEGGAVTVALRTVDREVEVAVSDSGPGIAAEEIPQLFERFGQGGSGRRSRAGGTGLGLLICRRVVEGHGGRIWIESEPGQGTRVAFRLGGASDPAVGGA